MEQSSQQAREADLGATGSKVEMVSSSVGYLEEKEGKGETKGEEVEKEGDTTREEEEEKMNVEPDRNEEVLALQTNAERQALNFVIDASQILKLSFLLVTVVMCSLQE